MTMDSILPTPEALSVTGQMVKWKCKFSSSFPTHLTSASPGLGSVGDCKREKRGNTSFTGMSVERFIC